MREIACAASIQPYQLYTFELRVTELLEMNEAERSVCRISLLLVFDVLVHPLWSGSTNSLPIAASVGMFSCISSINRFEKAVLCSINLSL